MSEILDDGLDSKTPPIQHSKALKINAIIFVCYTIFDLLEFKNDTFLSFLIFCMVIHIGSCLLMGIVMIFSPQDKEAKYYFLSAGLVLLLGFGTCSGLDYLKIL